MSTWHRFHLNETLKAMATSDNHRFFVHFREPYGEHRNPPEFYRWNLSDAKDSADRIIQAFYPHECDEGTCSAWRRVDV
jgi:hypothetical protein